MTYLLSGDQRLDFLKMPFGGLPAQGDELSGTSVIQPAIIVNVGTQHHVGLLARRFGHANLPALNAAQENFQHAASGEIVDLPLRRRRFAKKFAPLLSVVAR